MTNDDDDDGVVVVVVVDGRVTLLASCPSLLDETYCPFESDDTGGGGDGGVRLLLLSPSLYNVTKTSVTAKTETASLFKTH